MFRILNNIKTLLQRLDFYLSKRPKRGREKRLLTFQDFHALREVWIVFWIPRTVKFLFSVVTDSEFLARVLFCNVPHLTTYNVVYNDWSRRCADIPPTFPGVE